jgi:chitinase
MAFNIARSILFLMVLNVFSICVLAYEPKMAIYWGQESNGPEQSLRYYCESGRNFDIIIMAFVYLFPDADGSKYPGLNFAGHCSDTFDGYSDVLNCQSTIGPDITYCQSQGVQVLLSFGGAEGAYGFESDTDASTFATTVWNMFMEGTSSVRPFGQDVYIDGVDLDIEQGDDTGYATFISTLRSYFATSSRQYYISAAPQCPYPDILGPTSGSPFTTAWFDYVWIQFYNNYC